LTNPGGGAGAVRGLPAGAPIHPCIRILQTGLRHDAGQSARVLAMFPRASILAKGLVVFDIKGNSYRLVARVDFGNRGGR
jgi:HigB_toxin, RelE-like toxic component of a toxin-antitoxin system